ncbi:MAG: thermonuclease family protein [bacterium]|nr:thermonuclease family protein [bacterium]
MRYIIAAWAGYAALLGLVVVSPAGGKTTVEEFSGEVVVVSDGDTIAVLRDGDKVELRLEGIDAPEEGQAFSDVARDGLAHAILGKVVRIRCGGRDLENRMTGRVYLGELDINLELVKAGLAWHYRPVSSEKALSEAEKAARKAKTGLWQQRLKPVPPWKFRELQEEPDEERSVEQEGYIG